MTAHGLTTASGVVDEALLQDAATRAIAYLRDVGQRRVVPNDEALQDLDALVGPLPDSPRQAGDVLAILDRIGSSATVTSAGGRFFGFVTGGAVPASVAATWLAAAWNQNASLTVMSPAAAALEDAALEWTRDILRLPTGCGGALVTGATMANFAGLAAARHALLERAGWDVESNGLFGAPSLTVVVGDEVHVSLLKALALVGLGRARVQRVPVDSQGRMRADALPRLDARTIVCMQAGNVNSGAFDPAREVCEKAREAGAWVHVDGAFGLWAAASPPLRHLTDGFDRADSWATDAHKWPNAGYDCGLVFVRDPLALRAAMGTSAAYFVPGEQREPSQFTPEMSRRARGVELWATLASIGRQGLSGIVERTCRHARRFAEGLRARGFEILNDVVINQVLVSFGPPDVTREAIRRIQADGTCWCGATEWHGRTAMRISVSSWATTDEDVEISLAAMIRAADAASLNARASS
jgi:glutamate/tyrosine decarboxylase-like PLP-dependent enzyme